MNPQMLLQLLGAFGGLGGLFFHDNGNANLLKLLKQYTNPAALSKNADFFYNQWLKGPAFTGAQQDIMAGQNSMASSLAQSLAARGLTTSGIGAISNAAVPAAGNFQMANLRAQGRNQAMEQALRAAQLMIGGAGSMQPSRNIGAEVYGGGLDALSKMLQMLPYQQKSGPASLNGLGPAPYGTRGSDYFETLMQTPFSMGR